MRPSWPSRENKPENDPTTPEGAEVADLLKRSSVGDYLAEAVAHETLTGAPKELREALLGHNQPGWLPLEMLEQRADAVTGITTATVENQAPIAGRVFARSSMDYMGVAQPSIAIGDYNLPRINAGSTADVRSPSVELDGAAATLDVDTLAVVRLTSSYTYTVESAQKVRGFGDALAADLRGVMAEKRDQLMLNGQDAVAATSPAVTGIIGSLEDPTNPPMITSGLDVLGDYDASVDGKYAYGDQQVRMLANAECWRFAMNLQIPSSTNAAQLLRDRLSDARFRASANMPATVTDIATVLTYAAGAGVRGAVSPIWGGGLQLISDPYTGAKAGQTLLTALMLTSFAVGDAAVYKRHEWKLA